MAMERSSAGRTAGVAVLLLMASCEPAPSVPADPEPLATALDTGAPSDELPARKAIPQDGPMPGLVAYGELTRQEDELEAERRRSEIEAEIATLVDHPWAGSYLKVSARGHHGSNSDSLVLAPIAGFVAIASIPAVVLTKEHSWGTLEVSGEALTLHHKEPNRREHWRQAWPEQLLVVPWGERHYLLEPKELEAFARSLHTGDEPRSSSVGNFLLRSGDWSLRARGRPDVPASARELFRATPLLAIVFTHDGSTPASVELDVGQRDGVLVGQRFFQKDDELTVTVVAEESCRASVRALATDVVLPEIGSRWWSSPSLRARIIALEEVNTTEGESGQARQRTRATLDVGSRQGIHAGMLFRRRSALWAEFEVTEVSEDSCSGMLPEWPSQTLLAIGDELETARGKD